MIRIGVLRTFQPGLNIRGRHTKKFGGLRKGNQPFRECAVTEPLKAQGPLPLAAKFFRF
jgi:hypothetical protein